VRAFVLDVEEGAVQSGQAVGHADDCLPLVRAIATFNTASHQTFNTLCDTLSVDLGDPVTFARMYDEYGGQVYGAALRILGDAARAQDVAHDVFLRVWRNPQRFDARRGELGPYLRLMARSRALDVWREAQAAGRARDRLELVVAQAEPRADERPSAVAEHADERAAVRVALRRLTAVQREAVVLAYWGGMSADEIARRSGVPVGTAKSRIRLGLAKLRTEIAGPAAGEVPVAAAA
jgi:RNA polymerase sigma-70 factor (ECF subfamily)